MSLALSKTRKIIHCDCDCFFAAVEMRDEPALRDVPLAVGGAAHKRGVIATCNYLARDYGVRSAMPTGRALRLCPSLVVIPPNFAKYQQVARQIRTIFCDYTEKVEPLSLDEAFLDVTDCTQHRGSATLIGEEIRARVFATTGITISVGIAENKFLAKIASDWRKPNGLFVITPDRTDDFVRMLPVRKIFGVGEATEKKLAQLGVITCADLRTVKLATLLDKFGAMGERLYQLCRGVDSRDVVPDRRRKSLSIEQTYDVDLADSAACLSRIPALVDGLITRLARVDDSYTVVKQFLKIRFDNFSITTIERGAGQVDSEFYSRLCAEAWLRGARPVRLLGVGVRFADLREVSDIRSVDVQPQLFP